MTDTIVYEKNQWKWWKASLAGERPPMHADTPMQGYYAYKGSASAAIEPVAFWYDGGAMLCKRGDKLVDYGLDIWMSAGRNPITHAVYLSVTEGNPWPSEIIVTMDDGSKQSSMVKGIGDNSGAISELARISGDIDTWVATAEKLKKKGQPKTQVEANALADVATKIAELQKEADAARDAEKRPFLTAGREVDAKWRIPISKADIYKDLKALGQKFLNAENARRAAEAKKLQAELDAGKAEGDAGVKVETVSATMGTRKTVSIVKRKVVKFTDLKKAAEYFASMENPPAEFIEAMSKNAYKILFAGATVPGAKLEEQEFVR